MDNKTIKHLKELEAESIYVLREVAAQFERPVILFSGGKDSIVITYLAYKAFYPAKIPFPLLHIDTGHNFEETIQYRDELAKKLGAELIVGSVQESIDKGRVKEETGYYASRNMLERGIYVSPSQFEGNFISLCHTDEILDYVLKSIAESIEVRNIKTSKKSA